MLERVKHLFNVDGVIFIIATDTRQLQHTVRAVYGGEFDAIGYLTRFFDRSYIFRDPSHEAFVQKLFGEHQGAEELLSVLPHETPVSLFVSMMAMYGADLTGRRAVL